MKELEQFPELSKRFYTLINANKNSELPHVTLLPHSARSGRVCVAIGVPLHHVGLPTGEPYPVQGLEASPREGWTHSLPSRLPSLFTYQLRGQEESKSVSLMCGRFQVVSVTHGGDYGPQQVFVR